MSKHFRNAQSILGLPSKNRLVFLSAVILPVVTCISPVSNAVAAQRRPAELIQSELPAKKTLADASDVQLLEAVYRSVKASFKHRSTRDAARRQAALIVKTAGEARPALRSDLLCVAVRSLKENGALSCKWVAGIVREWIDSDPQHANQLMQVMGDCSSDCREAIQMAHLEIQANEVSPPENINPPPGSSMAGIGGASAEATCVVCQNGNNIEIGCSEVDNYLENHPGTMRGPCQASPMTNR